MVRDSEETRLVSSSFRGNLVKQTSASLFPTVTLFREKKKKESESRSSRDLRELYRTHRFSDRSELGRVGDGRLDEALVEGDEKIVVLFRRLEQRVDQFQGAPESRVGFSHTFFPLTFSPSFAVREKRDVDASHRRPFSGKETRAKSLAGVEKTRGQEREREREMNSKSELREGTFPLGKTSAPHS